MSVSRIRKSQAWGPVVSGGGSLLEKGAPRVGASLAAPGFWVQPPVSSTAQSVDLPGGHAGTTMGISCQERRYLAHPGPGAKRLRPPGAAGGKGIRAGLQLTVTSPAVRGHWHWDHLPLDRQHLSVSC